MWISQLLAVADLRGALPAPPPPPSTDQNFLNLMQFFGKLGKKYMLSPPTVIILLLLLLLYFLSHNAIHNPPDCLPPHRTVYGGHSCRQLQFTAYGTFLWNSGIIPVQPKEQPGTVRPVALSIAL